MKRSELGKVLNGIKDKYYIQAYIALKGSMDYFGYYEKSLAYISGICDRLILDNLINESQIEELYDATKEYMHTASSGRLNELFEDMRKGVEK